MSSREFQRRSSKSKKLNRSEDNPIIASIKERFVSELVKEYKEKGQQSLLFDFFVYFSNGSGPRGDYQTKLNETQEFLAREVNIDDVGRKVVDIVFAIMPAQIDDRALFFSTLYDVQILLKRICERGVNSPPFFKHMIEDFLGKIEIHENSTHEEIVKRCLEQSERFVGFLSSCYAHLTWFKIMSIIIGKSHSRTHSDFIGRLEEHAEAAIQTYNSDDADKLFTTLKKLEIAFASLIPDQRIRADILMDRATGLSETIVVLFQILVSSKLHFAKENQKEGLDLEELVESGLRKISFSLLLLFNSRIPIREIVEQVNSVGQWLDDHLVVQEVNGVTHVAASQPLSQFLAEFLAVRFSLRVENDSARRDIRSSMAN